MLTEHHTDNLIWRKIHIRTDKQSEQWKYLDNLHIILIYIRLIVLILRQNRVYNRCYDVRQILFGIKCKFICLVVISKLCIAHKLRHKQIIGISCKVVKHVKRKLIWRKRKNLLHTAEITFNSKFYPCTAVIPYKIDHNLYNRLCGKCVIFQSEFCQYNRYTAAYNSCGNHTKSDTHELFFFH